MQLEQIVFMGLGQLASIRLSGRRASGGFIATSSRPGQRSIPWSTRTRPIRRFWRDHEPGDPADPTTLIACAGGGTIRVAPYAKPSAPRELSEHAVRGSGGPAGLPARTSRHDRGRGRSLSKRCGSRSRSRRWVFGIHGYLQIGTPRLLPPEEIENVLGRIAGYGPADK